MGAESTGRADLSFWGEPACPRPLRGDQPRKVTTLSGMPPRRSRDGRRREDACLVRSGRVTRPRRSCWSLASTTGLARFGRQHAPDFATLRRVELGESTRPEAPGPRTSSSSRRSRPAGVVDLADEVAAGEQPARRRAVDDRRVGRTAGRAGLGSAATSAGLGSRETETMPLHSDLQRHPDGLRAGRRSAASRRHVSDHRGDPCSPCRSGCRAGRPTGGVGAGEVAPVAIGRRLRRPGCRARAESTHRMARVERA